MATKATKLPSGSWRVRVQLPSADGKQHYKSFTAPTRKEAEYLAAQYAFTQKDKRKPQLLTVGEAIDAYIDARSDVLSPGTVREYKRSRKRDFQMIETIRLSALTSEDIQRQINALSVGHSPKTVRNVYALLTAMLHAYHPDLALYINLPGLVKHEIEIPEKSEIDLLLEAVQGSPMENAILLGAAYGMRRAEICALLYSDIDVDNSTITVNKSYTKNVQNKLILKTPKTYAGTRTIRVSPMIIVRLLDNRTHSDLVCPLTPDAVTRRFERLCARIGIQCRFHDLRHYNASLMLSLLVPDKYAMERLGQATPGMLKAVYQHVMSSKREDVASAVNKEVESFV